MPATVRAMTPDETDVLIAGWNAAQKAASGNLSAPTSEEYDELVAKYG
jgi:hypothetical protein